MIVKDMIEMLELADKDSQVMLEIRDKKVNLIGYFEVGSDHLETGGYGGRIMSKVYWVFETTTKAYTVKADNEEQAIDDMENQRDTILKVRDVDREVYAEEKE